MPSGDARAWPDNPQPSRNPRNARRIGRTVRDLLCTGALEVGEECLVWRLVGCCPLGLRRCVTFPAAPSAAPQTQKPRTPDTTRDGCSRTLHHIPVQPHVDTVARSRNRTWRCLRSFLPLPSPPLPSLPFPLPLPSPPFLPPFPSLPLPSPPSFPPSILPSFHPSIHSDTPQATGSTARRVSQECLTRVVCSRFSFRWLLLRPARFCTWPPFVLRSILARTDGVFRYVRLPRRVQRSSSQDLLFEAELRVHLLEAACGTVVFSVHTPYCFIFFIFLSLSCPSLVCLLCAYGFTLRHRCVPSSLLGCWTKADCLLCMNGTHKSRSMVVDVRWLEMIQRSFIGPEHG